MNMFVQMFRWFVHCIRRKGASTNSSLLFTFLTYAHFLNYDMVLPYWLWHISQNCRISKQASYLFDSKISQYFHKAIFYITYFYSVWPCSKVLKQERTIDLTVGTTVLKDESKINIFQMWTFWATLDVHGAAKINRSNTYVNAQCKNVRIV